MSEVKDVIEALTKGVMERDALREQRDDLAARVAEFQAAARIEATSRVEGVRSIDGLEPAVMGRVNLCDRWEEAVKQRDNLAAKVALVEAALKREVDRLGHGGRTLEEAVRDAISPEKKRVRGWVNVYSGPETSILWPSRAEADKYADSFKRRIACIEIDAEEGEGL